MSQKLKLKLLGHVVPDPYGPELLTNGDMESGDPPTGWVVGVEAPILSSVEDQSPNGIGTKALNIEVAIGQTTGPVIYEIAELKLGSSYVLKMNTKGANGNYSWIIIYSQSWTVTWGQIDTTITPDWTEYSSTFVCTEPGMARVVIGFVGIPGQGIRVDDVSLKEIL